MKKDIVKINENTLRQIVAESVKKVLDESWRDKSVMDYVYNLYSASYAALSAADDDELKNFLGSIYCYAKEYIKFYNESGLEY